MDRQQLASIEQKSCACGRSPSGKCVGLHKMTNEEYQKYLDEKRILSEQRLLTE